MSDNRKTKTQVKNTDEYRSKNRWMEIDIEQRGALEEANQNKTCKDLSSTNSGSKPKKTDIILCLLSNSAGARRGRIGQGNAF